MIVELDRELSTKMVSPTVAPSAAPEHRKIAPVLMILLLQVKVKLDAATSEASATLYCTLVVFLVLAALFASIQPDNTEIDGEELSWADKIATIKSPSANPVGFVIVNDVEDVVFAVAVLSTTTAILSSAYTENTFCVERDS